MSDSILAVFSMGSLFGIVFTIIVMGLSYERVRKRKYGGNRNDNNNPTSNGGVGRSNTIHNSNNEGAEK